MRRRHSSTLRHLIEWNDYEIMRNTNFCDGFIVVLFNDESEVEECRGVFSYLNCFVIFVCVCMYSSFIKLGDMEIPDFNWLGCSKSLKRVPRLLC